MLSVVVLEPFLVVVLEAIGVCKFTSGTAAQRNTRLCLPDKECWVLSSPQHHFLQLNIYFFDQIAGGSPSAFTLNYGLWSLWWVMVS
uniref:Secreted protein n=1 Tax=Pyxicephalus adspersus TaxID=30357 RepID=A0AAV3AQM3_PYXAD|nr:TPA: hypothetical protein GDO54_006175 [Pyxicephalus adspersus]